MKIDLMTEINKCWSNKSTGALFVKLSNRRLLQMFFVNGELQSVKCRGDVGMEAIKEASFFEAIESKFYLGVTNQAHNSLPLTVDIIYMLNTQAFGRAPASTLNRPATLTPSARIKKISKADQVMVKDVFVEYIGPIAEIIFFEELPSVSSVENLVDHLSVHIDSAESQEKFKNEIMLKLN
jgi:hypothetical protein